MSQSGLSFTLLESGTSRLHFRLAKALEDAVSPDQQDLIIIDTIAQIRAQLASRSSSNNVTKLTSALLTLLHCCYHYPVSSGSFPSSRTAIDVGFALVPTLQLLGLATEWKHLLLAYQLLPFLLPSKARSDHAVGGISEKPGRSEDLISSETQTLASASTSSPLSSSIVRGRSSGLRPSSPSYQGEVSRASSLASPNVDETSSLLLLNTFRSNLTAATAAAATQPRQVTRREQSSRSRSRSPSVSRPSTKATDIFSLDPSSVRVRFRALASLRSLATGTPHGPAVLPSLASTLVALTRHSDDTIRSTTLKAMLACASVNIQNQPDRDGQNEMLDAALTIVRLTLASTYAFSPGSGIGEQQGMILAEMDRRVDSNPSVLRACIKLSNHAREKGLITEQEAACHAIEALQASRWAPMHLELPALQQHRVVSTVVDLTKGIRERMAARQRTSLQADHDYYGIYAPWLVEACLSSLATSVKSMQKENASRMQMDESTEKELLKVVLRIYNTASQEKASALALCVSAAHCIGALYTRSENITQASPRSSRLHTDGELVALWSVLSTHIDSQLRSSNPNRKTSGLVLLETLLPVGWAQATAHPDPSEGDGKHHTESTSPLKISEMQMGHLMSLLTDPDSSIRTRILTLLNKVDSGLPALLRTQLQATLDAEIQHSGPPVESMAYVAQRLIEVALFAVTSSPAGQTVSGAAGAMSALQQAIDSGVKLGLFDPSERKLNFQQEAWAKSILSSVSNLSIDNRLELLQRLTENVESNGLSLICDLICDLTVRDIRQSEEAIDRFVGWVSGQRLGDDGFVGLLRKGSEQKNASHARQTVLGATARTISLVVQLVGPSQASADLVKCFTSLDPLLANIVESEQRTALRAQASNLQLICHTLQHLDPLSESTLALKIGSLAAPFQNTEDAARRLLEFHLDDLTSKEADDVRSVSSVSTGSSLLAAASRFFAPSSRLPRSAAPSDSYSAPRLRSRLPEFLLHSSHLISPNDSTAILRSSRKNTRNRSGNSRDRNSLPASAIPSESKRLRDQSVAQVMSNSIANLVLGSDAKLSSSDNEVIFSATSSRVLKGEEIELVYEVADPERRLDTSAGKLPSLLDLVHQCHNHEPWLDTSLTPFVLDGVQIGFLPARVMKACIDDSVNQRRVGAPPVLRQVRFAMNHREIVPPTATSRVCEAITFTAEFGTPEARTSGLNGVAQRWREARIFPDPLDGWRGELYAIYGLNPQPGCRNPIAFKLERAACALFGFATFGVHLTAYTVSPTTGELKVWVPQRSSTKSTWPGYLDNSVAGGIVAGDLPMESMVRECEEEANLESSVVEKHVKQVGVLSYCYKTRKQGWIQPEVEYVYDLPLPAHVVLQPKDGEVDHFNLMTLDEIYEKMREGRFKANCVLVLLDFLIRHGHITADKEPGYRQIVTQLHVDLRLPGP